MGWKPKLTPGLYNLDEYEKIAGVTIKVFHEAPMLGERVAAGRLPPVEERLPENPLVMEPWEKIGKYGGTLRYCEFALEYDHYLRHINDAQLLELAPSPSHHRYNFVGSKVLPGIFEFWQASEDARTFTFRIRKGLKWSDGVPVTTEDVRYTIEDVALNEEITSSLPLLQENHPKWVRWGGRPVKLEIVDDCTFRLKFAKSYGLFVSQLVNWRWASLIRPSHYLKQFHKKYTSWEKLLPLMKERGYKRKEEWGKFYNSLEPPTWDAGPFVPTAYPNVFDYPSLDPWIHISQPKPGEFILERNPYFYKIDPEGSQLPYIDKIHRIFVHNLKEENRKILTGKTDIQCQKLRLSDCPLFMKNRKKGGYKVMLLKAWQDQMLMFWLNLCPNDPVLRKIVQDVRFRQAMSLALNREEIKESIFLGFGRPAQIAPVPGSAYYEEEFEKAYAQYDPDRANRLLDEMGLRWDENHQYRLRPDGKRLTLPLLHYDLTPPASPGAELASKYWKAIGIDVPVKKVDVRCFMELQEANQVVLSVWWLDGANITDPFWYQGFHDTTPKWWQWYITDGKRGTEPIPAAKRVYELRDIIFSTPSEEERIKAGKELFRLQAENLWVIGTVAQTPTPFVYSKRLGNISIAEKKKYYSIVVGEAAEQWFFKK